MRLNAFIWDPWNRNIKKYDQCQKGSVANKNRGVFVARKKWGTYLSHLQNVKNNTNDE
jgi:hypothetical protein